MNKSTVGYITLIILLLITGFFSLSRFFQQRADHDILDIRTFPQVIGDWQGRDIDVSESDYRILETRNLIFREYTNSSTNDKLSLFIIYSETNRSVFHPPEVCLIGSGITISDKKTEKIETNQKEFLANKLYLEKDDYRGIALYCYSAGNFYTENFYLQQARFAFNQFFARHRGGATIRVLMQVKENEESTLAILKPFIQEVIKTMNLCTKLTTAFKNV